MKMDGGKEIIQITGTFSGKAIEGKNTLESWRSGNHFFSLFTYIPGMAMYALILHSQDKFYCRILHNSNLTEEVIDMKQKFPRNNFN